MKIKDITTLIEAMAPLSLQESYDNAGLICGSPEAEVRSALLATDVTEEVLDEAIAGGHDLIITHHPLTLQGVKHLRPEGYVQRCLIKAVRHELNLYAAHTNLDAVMQGVSGRMADKLGLEEQEVLQPLAREGSDGEPAGFGIVGNLPREEEATGFLRRVKEVFGCGVVRHTAVCKERVRRVAVCGGAGAFLTREAIARGADIYITGDYKYHDFFMAENRIILADIGHYESEQFTKEVIFELLVKNLSNFAVQFSKVRTNPVYYL
jgi:dinuclear metal center YbgI/SA1388 family protein